MVKHTYLLQEGRWSVSGTHYGEGGEETPVEGTSEVRHRDGFWLVAGTLRLPETGWSVGSEYRIGPVTDGGSCFPLFCESPETGKLSGELVMVHEMILMSYASESGEWSGVEALVKQNDHVYLSRGYAFKGKHASSWAVVLVRED